MYLYMLPLFQQSTALCLHNLMQTMTEVCELPLSPQVPKSSLVFVNSLLFLYEAV